MGDKILVVDDALEIREILDTFLTEEGYEVILASNGEEALEIAEKENPQVILMDVQMPGIGGIEACRKLKTQEKTGSIPIIMITAHEDRDAEAFVKGADDIVIKPLNMLDISFRVKSMLRIRHLTDQLERSLAYIEELEKNRPDQ